MKKYFINSFEVSENTYKQYVKKELKRYEFAKVFNLPTVLEVFKNKTIINDIQFEVKRHV
jgi:hypothetical protein